MVLHRFQMVYFNWFCIDFNCFGIDFNSSHNCSLAEALNFVDESCIEETLQDCAEDVLESASGCFWQTEDVESSSESGGDRGSTTTRRGCTPNDGAISDIFPCPLTSLVHSLSVQEQSEELNWWLGSILFNTWHVDVVDEDGELLAWWSTE